MSEINIYNLNIHQGETWALTLTIKDKNDAPKNLTGYTGKMEIRSKPGDTVLATLSTAATGMVITGASGEVALTMSAAITGALNFRKAGYDIFIYSNVGTATPLLKGDVTVEARITQ